MSLAAWIVLGLFPVVQIALFYRLAPAKALAWGFVLGFICLPNRVYRPLLPGEDLNVFGLLLHDGAWLTKASWLVLWALVGSLLFHRSTVRRFRPAWIDLPAMVWVVVPMGSAGLNGTGWSGWIAALYTSWVLGGTWFLARVLLADSRARRELLAALSWCTLFILPLVGLEFFLRPFLYEAVYGFHPFQVIGAQRYVGYRPMVFFEDGNQLGIWLAISGIAAAALWASNLALRQNAGERDKQASTPWKQHGAAAVLLGAAVIMVQSAGAVLLYGFALIWQFFSVRFSVKWLVLVCLLLGMLYAGGRAAGVLDTRQMVASMPWAAKARDLLKATGRGSLGWRVKVEEKALKVAMRRPVLGAGRMDWWRELDVRPWGLWPLILGAYGFLGMLNALLIWLIAPVVWHLKHGPKRARSPSGRVELGLVCICLVLVVDGALNSMVPVVGLLCCGALASACLEPKSKSLFLMR